ncbi:MAG TPA: DUF6452 family protein [Flavobacterium sp.]
MKKLLLLSVIVLALCFISCEKDDICDENTATTPRLIVKFFDLANPTIAKNVTQLSVVGEGMTDTLNVFNGVNTIELPLKTTEDITQYRFILNSTNAAIANEDKLQFNYSRENIFVSRACGYKTLYTLADSDAVIHTDATVPDGFWMQNIIISEPNIQNEDETHISIYF